MKRKILSVLIALCMVLSLLPVSALAAPAPDCEGGESCLHEAAVGTTHYDTLAEAVSAAEDGKTVELLKDITYTSGKCLDISKQLTLDLCGFSITTPANGSHPNTLTHFIRIEKTGDLTITDSSASKTGSITVSYSGNSNLHIIDVYGKLTVEGGLIVNAGGSATNYGSCSVYVNGSGTFVLNGGEIAAAKAKKRAYPVYNLGTTEINGGKITSTGTDCAVYSEGRLTVTDGDITQLAGSTAISAASKAVTAISGGSFKGILKAAWIDAGSVAVYDGAATTFVSSAPEDYAAIINGSLYFTGENGADKALAQAVKGDTLTLRSTPTAKKSLALNASLTVTLEENAEFDSSYITPETGCRIEVTEISDTTTKYTIVVDEAQAEAIIGSTYYKTLGNANVGAKDGDTITILKDINYGSSCYSMTKNITIDLNGHKIESQKKASSAGNEYAAVIRFAGAGKTLTITDSSEEKTGAVVNSSEKDYGYALIAVDGTIRIEGGNYSGTPGASALYAKNGTFTITGGTFPEDPTAYTADGYIVKKLSDTSFEVMEKSGLTKGTYTTDPRGCLAGDGYFAVENSDGTWSVYYTPPIDYNNSSVTDSETTNPDGSVTKTETKDDGTVIKTTTDTEVSADGTRTETTVEVVTANDGTVTVTETVKSTDSTGTTAEKTTEVDEAGNTSVSVDAEVSASAAADAENNDSVVTLPVEVDAGASSENAPVVNIDVPAASDPVKVEIPVKNMSNTTVAVLVNPDGTEEIIMDCKVGENGVVVELEGDAALKIIDNGKDFADVKDDWTEAGIDYVSARGIFDGTSDTTFSPDANMTRAMLMTILARFDGEDTAGGATWYEKGMDWAKAAGVSDGTNPGANITREQMAVMLYRYAGEPETKTALNFPDAGNVSAYAKDAVSWAVENGLLNGMNGNLNPQGYATRAQVAAIMMRFCQNVAE